MHYTDDQLLLLTKEQFKEIPSSELKPFWRYEMTDAKYAGTWYALEPYIDKMMMYLGERQYKEANPDVDYPYESRLFLPCISYNIWAKAFDDRIKIEAYIISGLSNKQLLNKLPKYNKVLKRLSERKRPELFEWYRKVFFDIDEYRDDEKLMHKQVLKPVQEICVQDITGGAMLNFLSKNIAMYSGVSGVDDFVKIILSKPSNDRLAKMNKLYQKLVHNCWAKNNG